MNTVETMAVVLALVGVIGILWIACDSDIEPSDYDDGGFYGEVKDSDGAEGFL